MRWRAFPLNPDTPEEGIALADLLAQKGILATVDNMNDQLQAAADSVGLPMGRREHSYNSRKAQELGLWAETKGQGHAFHDAAFRAYFVDGLNLASKGVLLDLARSVGLDPHDAETVLDNRNFKAAVDADWQAARDQNIPAAPTFIMGSDRLVGARPYEALEKLVQKHL